MPMTPEFAQVAARRATMAKIGSQIGASQPQLAQVLGDVKEEPEETGGTTRRETQEFKFQELMSHFDGRTDRKISPPPLEHSSESTSDEDSDSEADIRDGGMQIGVEGVDTSSDVDEDEWKPQAASDPRLRVKDLKGSLVAHLDTSMENLLKNLHSSTFEGTTEPVGRTQEPNHVHISPFDTPISSSRAKPPGRR